NTDQCGKTKEFERSDNCVRHSATGDANRFWQLSEERPVDRACAATNQIKKNQHQRCDYQQGADKTNPRRDRAFCFSPETFVLASRFHCTARVADVDPIARKSNRPSRFITMVMPKRTRPISNSACR